MIHLRACKHNININTRYANVIHMPTNNHSDHDNNNNVFFHIEGAEIMESRLHIYIRVCVSYKVIPRRNGTHKLIYYCAHIYIL